MSNTFKPRFKYVGFIPRDWVRERAMEHAGYVCYVAPGIGHIHSKCGIFVFRFS